MEQEKQVQELSEQKRVITEGYFRGVMAASVIWSLVFIVMAVMNFQLIQLVTDVVLKK